MTPLQLLPILAIVVALAGLTAAFATPLVRKLAMHVGMVDEVGERRMHEQPKPRIGGIAVFLGFAFALFSVLGYLIARNSLHDFDKIHDIIGMLFGGTLILMVGIWDDIMGMTPRNKFVAQIVVAGISLLYGFVIKDVENPFHRGDYIHFGVPWNYALSLIWYVGMMNAINFIDGLDGLLSGLTAISGASLAIIAVGHGHPELALVLAALVGGARLGRAVHRLRLRHRLDHRHLENGVYDLAADSAGRTGAADSRHAGHDRAPHLARQIDHRRRPGPLSPSTGVPLRPQRAPSSTADLRAVRRARRRRVSPIGRNRITATRAGGNFGHGGYTAVSDNQHGHGVSPAVSSAGNQVVANSDRGPRAKCGGRGA
jgi:hypothetical protein